MSAMTPQSDSLDTLDDLSVGDAVYDKLTGSAYIVTGLNYSGSSDAGNLTGTVKLADPFAGDNSDTVRRGADEIDDQLNADRVRRVPDRVVTEPVAILRDLIDEVIADTTGVITANGPGETVDGIESIEHLITAKELAADCTSGQSDALELIDSIS